MGLLIYLSPTGEVEELKKGFLNLEKIQKDKMRKDKAKNLKLRDNHTKLVEQVKSMDTKVSRCFENICHFASAALRAGSLYQLLYA